MSKTEKYKDMMRVAEEYFTLVRQGQDVDKEKLAERENRLNELSIPFSDDPAFMSLLKLERSTANHWNSVISELKKRNTELENMFTSHDKSLAAEYAKGVSDTKRKMLEEISRIIVETDLSMTEASTWNSGDPGSYWACNKMWKFVASI